MFKQKPKKSVGCGHKNKQIIGLASTFFGVAAAVFCVLEAFASVTIERINYVGNVTKAFDVKAQIGETLVNTALGNNGFSLLFAVGDNSVEVENIANGASVENDGVKLTITGVDTTDHEGLTITYKLENENEEAKSYKLATYADTEFAGNTNNDLSRTGNSSIRMIQQDNTLENYGAEMTLSFVPNASTTWIGDKDNIADNLFSAGADDTFSGDSALAYSWAGSIDAGAAVKYSTVATPGENFTGNVSFYRKGATAAFDTQSEVLGSAINVPTVSSYTGYGTCSWNSANDGSGDEYTAGESFILTDKSLNIFEVCEATSYDISYTLNGGSVDNPTTYTIESPSFTLERPTRTGYSFLGWTGTELAQETLDVTINQGSYGDREYTANWQINQYTISFNSNGGSTVDDITKDYGAEVTEPNDPTRTGYDFAGWHLEGDENEYSFTTMPAENITLYADWTPTVYNISYDFNEGNEVDNPATYTIETETFGLNNPTRIGHTFTGWTGTELDEPSTNVTIAQGSYGDREYTATWRINQYTISFNSNGGTDVISITGDYNSEVSSPEEGPTRTGYTFTGWYTDPECEHPYSFTTMPAENITLYAGWEITNYNLTVTNGTHASVKVSENGSEVASLNAEASATVVTTYFQTNVIKITPDYGYYVSTLTKNDEDKLGDLVNHGDYDEYTFTGVLEETTVTIATTEYARADYSAFEAAIASIPEDLSIYATNPVAHLNDLVEDFTMDRSAYNDRYIFDQDVVDDQTAQLEAAIAALKLIGTVTEDEADAGLNYGGAIITTLPEDLPVKIGLTEGEEEQRVADGVNVKLVLSVIAVDEDEADPDQTLVRDLVAANAEEYPTARIAQFLDVTLTKQLEGQAPILVTETAEPIEISAELPEEIREGAEDATREFYVARVHNGEVTVADAKLVDKRIYFESDEFSTFAIIYVDVPNVPDTGYFTALDSAAIATFLEFVLPFIVLSGLGYGIYLYRRRSC